MPIDPDLNSMIDKAIERRRYGTGTRRITVTKVRQEEIDALEAVAADLGIDQEEVVWKACRFFLSAYQSTR